MLAPETSTGPGRGWGQDGHVQCQSHGEAMLAPEDVGTHKPLCQPLGTVNMPFHHVLAVSASQGHNPESHPQEQHLVVARWVMVSLHLLLDSSKLSQCCGQYASCTAAGFAAVLLQQIYCTGPNGKGGRLEVACWWVELRCQQNRYPSVQCLLRDLGFLSSPPQSHFILPSTLCE